MSFWVITKYRSFTQKTNQPRVFIGWVAKHVLKLNLCNLDVYNIQDGLIQAPLWGGKSSPCLGVGTEFGQEGVSQKCYKFDHDTK